MCLLSNCAVMFCIEGLLLERVRAPLCCAVKNGLFHLLRLLDLQMLSEFFALQAIVAWFCLRPNCGWELLGVYVILGCSAIPGLDGGRALQVFKPADGSCKILGSCLSMWTLASGWF
ncbi:hypothetical protein Nepgr_029704 [Nepenthes gracilis]|uniref:Uncharacterized protein n=1 Tax=Nepenthes gracilis TaxID=150966 RepID=A0AAD3TFJ0_NEPGR|nr:hypothetical protein Nepgr_029704 [Nepenthes gracilis]